jgi:hypothetical protein
MYNVNLSKIKSNDELQSIIDYVTTQQNNSGIIVFEDIDTMSTLTHSRTNKYDDKNNEKEKDDDKKENVHSPAKIIFHLAKYINAAADLSDEIIMGNFLIYAYYLTM